MMCKFRKLVCFIGLLCLLPLHSLAGGNAVLRLDKQEEWVDSSRHVVYYQLETDDPSLNAAVKQINQAILDTSYIPEYRNLLRTVASGGTGMTIDTQVNASAGLYTTGKGYLALLTEAKGKMLQGPPSHAYYPMVFDVEHGEQVSFDDLFDDPQGARAYIETYLSQVVEPQLSTYLENHQLFPVPYDNFGFSTCGHLIFYYPHDQLSFLSGTSGAIAFRYSELWNYLDTSENSIALQMASSGIIQHQYDSDRNPGEVQAIVQEYPLSMPGLGNILPSLGTIMEYVEKSHALTTDSGYYPGGAYFETETPELLGAYLITDTNESYLSGILTSRVDMFGIETGKTSLTEAKRLLGMPMAELPFTEETARMYLTCPGVAAVYTFESDHPIHKGETGLTTTRVSLTLYADESGIVQYIKLSLE